MANALGTLFGDIAAAIREKTGDTATMKPAEFPSKISGIEVGGGSGGGSLPAGVHYTPTPLKAPNVYSQAWYVWNGVRYAFTNAATGNGSLANVYKMDDTTDTYTQLVSNTATALGQGNAGQSVFLEYNGLLYIKTSDSTNYLIFDGTTLTKKTGIPKTAGAQSMFVHNGKLKVHIQNPSTVYVFNESSEAWEEEATVLGGGYKNANVFTVNGVPYFVNSKKVYTYDGSTTTEVGAVADTMLIKPFAVGDVFYYGVTESGKPLALYKYDTVTNQNTKIGYAPFCYSAFSRFWEYDGKLSFLSNYDNSLSPTVSMTMHIIETAE